MVNVRATKAPGTQSAHKEGQMICESVKPDYLPTILKSLWFENHLHHNAKISVSLIMK